MSGTWEHPSPRRVDLPREFLISVEVYVSNNASTSLRKPPIQRKKGDIPRPSSASHGDSKKVKEKSSWISLSRSQTGSGHWRPATCKLSEEGDRCFLNIYVDETILYQTVFVHLLNHTDIRQADKSLFFRKHCLSIYCVTGQRWSSSHTAEPVYLQFDNAEACNTWLALLKSYSIPEIYGRWFFPADGGSYRMWRQVELTLVQGRNLGNTKPFVESAANTCIAGGAEPYSESEAVDLDVSCEINMNNTLCGRTTIKKGIGSPDWHENFTFSELPPFETLEVIVWREKKLFKPTIMGSVRIALSNFRRGETVEGWFPVLQSGPVASDLQVGDIRLKIRVDEEIILPHSAYSSLMQTFNTRNFLDWMTDFENKLYLKTVSTQLMSLAVAKNVLIQQVFELADREVDGTPSSHHTLFRGNTVLTKIMELTMSFYGKAFLEASVGAVLRRLCAEKVAIEVDPIRSGKGLKDVERNVEQLIYWCQEFWNQIYSVRTECPHEIRRLFEYIRKLVEKRYRIKDKMHDLNRELPWQSVSAFCFLRFIVPAILHPHLFGLCAGLPSVSVQRSLTLIAKVIQSLANLNSTVQKEEFMRGVKEFLRDSLPAMIDYILVVSTPASDPQRQHAGSADNRHDRLSVVNALRQRLANMPILDREAIPILPHLLDIPRHLAVIASAVIRSSRENGIQLNLLDHGDRRLEELCNKCFEIEEHALRQVNQLAARIFAERRQPSLPGSGNPNPCLPTAIPVSDQSRVSKTERRFSPMPSRPSTAPSSDSDLSRRLLSNSSLGGSMAHVMQDLQPETDVGWPSSPEGLEREAILLPDENRHHLKSVSTDGTTSPPGIAFEDTTTTSFVEDGTKTRKGLLRGILSRR